jgi:hypothetical protein
MLEYLVTSKTRRRLLTALWKDRARGTASSLARRADVPFGAGYGELKAMSRAGLARESLESGRLVYEADRASPYAAVLEQLVATAGSQVVTKPDSDLASRADSLRGELARQGAPLWNRTPGASGASLEELLARACELSHRDPSVAKLLPYLFLRKKNELSFARLERALTEHKQKHTGGFLLALAASLSGDKTMRTWSKRLKDKRRTKPVDFFPEASSKRLRALAERNTPALARAWSFRLNMSMDDFRSVMEKFPLDDHLSS